MYLKLNLHVKWLPEHSSIQETLYHLQQSFGSASKKSINFEAYMWFSSLLLYYTSHELYDKEIYLASSWYLHGIHV